MTFAAIANMISGQRPFFLYRFSRAGVETLFTSQPVDVTRTVAGVTGTVWSAAAISHARMPNSSASYRSEFPITLPLSDAFARSFLAPQGINRARVTIWKGFTNDPDSELVVQYTGAVIGARPDERGTITLNCMGDVSTLLRNGPAAVFQRPCRHAVYHGKCGLSLAAFQISATITAISADGLSLTVPGAAAQPDGYFRAGILEFAGAREMIVSHAGTAIGLSAPVPGLLAQMAASGSASILIAPGCDLTTTTCASRFSNLDNFGGFPWMADTPFDGRSIV